MSLTRAEYNPVCEQEVHLGRVWGVPRVTDGGSVLRVRNCCLVLIWASTMGKLQLNSDLPVHQVLLLVTLLVLHFPPQSVILLCFFILWWQMGRFPGTTVTVKWQWVMQMWGFVFLNLFFSLFLKGEELFLPIYSLCVCVNTFILNLKLIKYHFSQTSPDVLISVLWASVSHN